MKTLEHSIKINTSKSNLWRILWSDKTFRDWSSYIDEGTYMKGNLVEGEIVEFLSSVSEYGVSSLVAKCIPEKFVEFRHLSDTKDLGLALREIEWTGLKESYTLEEKNGYTLLRICTDVPPNQEETFSTRIPKALERIKFLAENS